MANKTNPSSPTSGKPLRMRMRPDLVVTEQRHAGEKYWVFKDPVSLSFFHLREQEFAILEMLDGCTATVAEITRNFNQRFAPQQLSSDHLHQFLARMHQAGLLLSETTGQDATMLARRGRRRRREIVDRATNVLAIRFRGFDPDALLDRVSPWVQPLFSRSAMIAAAVVTLAALLLLLFRFDELQSRLPQLDALLTWQNAALLAVTLAGVKIVHELAHALTCKHFGGRCHELGLMLLVFTPCLYCNVSDAWLLGNRWQRIAISAAGIVVEIVLAAVCTILWWYSEPGLLNTLCFNVMVIASVGTLLLNGNPLLRYDGYYILSDLVEVPNLAQQSRAALRHYASRLFLGTDGVGRPDLPRRHPRLLALYAIASLVYRVCLIVAILWMLKTVLAADNLEVIAYLLAIIVAVGMALPGLRRAARFVGQPFGRPPIQRGRMAASFLVFVGVLALLFYLPVPTYVAAPAVLEFDQAERVFVPIDGMLQTHVAPGQQVRAGEVLAQLENVDLDLEVARLTAERDAQQLLLSNLIARRSVDPEAARQIPSAREALTGLEERLAQLVRDHRRLSLIAPIDGAVLPAPRRPLPSGEEMQLASWHGGPLDEANRGCYLETGTLLCLVGDPRRFRADVVIDQADVDRVRVGQAVRVRLDQLPGQVLHGTIDEIAKIELVTPPRELTATRRLATSDDRSGRPETLDVVYQARVRLDDAPSYLIGGAAGEASVTVTSETLGRRFARFLARTFRVEL